MHQPRTSFFFLLLCLLLPLLLWQTTGCKKEHSCEGCLTPPSQPPPDTAIITSPPTTDDEVLPGCSLCVPTDKPLLNSWSFTLGKTYVCGNITNCGFIGGHTTFTFFGPSPCSVDTGIVMTVYLPFSFDADQTSVTAAGAAFYYYDNLAAKDILISQSSEPFIVNVQQYDASTGLTTGIFEGTVFKADGTTTTVENGKFKIMLK